MQTSNPQTRKNDKIHGEKMTKFLLDENFRQQNYSPLNFLPDKAFSYKLP